MASRKKSGKLDRRRTKLQKYVEKANELFRKLLSINPTAPALEQARRSKSRAMGVNQEDPFSVEELHRSRDLAREASRLKAFLSEGGQQYREQDARAQLKAENQEGFSAFRGTYFDEEGKQHNYWKERYGVSYDTSRISEDLAPIAFETYRALEESDPSLIYGEGAYGSENLIIAVYDIISKLSGKVAKQDLRDEAILRVRSELYGASPEASGNLDILTDRDYGILDRESKRR
jgi:hypothetical protein